MAKTDYIPYSPKKYPIADIAHLEIAVVFTEWNDAIVTKIKTSCVEELLNAGVAKDNIHEFSVPGSFELPMGSKMIISSSTKTDVIICLGCVIRGETKHDDYINHTIARSINNIALVSGIPVIYGVLTTNDEQQALERAGGSRGDKGIESAHAALKMISLKEQLEGQNRKISF